MPRAISGTRAIGSSALAYIDNLFTHLHGAVYQKIATFEEDLLNILFSPLLNGTEKMNVQGVYWKKCVSIDSDQGVCS
jgi:hypothetical protein